MRVTGSRVYSRPAPVPKMPPGLVELMEGLTRDVLKNNPPDVYEFCADHMRKLLEIRDGPSKQIPLSLEEKIKRAQEKVKRRADQRWRKYKQEQQEPIPNTVGCDQSSQVLPSAPDVTSNDFIPTVSKPVHHEEELAQTSEIEISCQSGDTVNQEIITKEITDPISENLSKENILDNKIASELELTKEITNEVHEQVSEKQETLQELISDEKEHNDEANLNVTTEEDSKSTNKIEDSNKNLEISENKNEKEEIITIEHQNEPPSTKTDENKEDKFIIPENVSDLVLKVDEKENETKLDHALLSDEIDTKHIDNIASSTLDNADEPPNMANDEPKEVNANITHMDENHLDDKNKADDTNIPNNVIAKDETNESDLINTTNHDDVEEKPDIESTQDHQDLENTDDMDKVVNDAIENIKRKDSSANDFVNYSNVLNEEESDASESSNFTENNLADLKPNEINYDVEENKDKINSLKDANTKTFENYTDVEKVQGYKQDIDDLHHDNLNQAVNEEAPPSEVCDHSDSVPGNNVPNEVVSGENVRNDNANAMDLETAAVTIQKVFRTFLFKSRNSTFDDNVNEENNLSDEEKKEDRQFLSNSINKERRTLGISRMDTVLQTVNEEKSLSLSTDDSSLSSAATTIQAHVRGFLVRNKLHSGKTGSSSLAASKEPSGTSIDGDADHNKNKTILNIHIVPEGGNYLSRDESMITSMDLSLDGSPPSSVNLHPLGYNTSERRKLLKREDAIQSVSPPSNNSGKLSEDVDSVKELINESDSNIASQDEKATMASLLKDDSHLETETTSLETTHTNSLTIETVLEGNKTSNTEMLSCPDAVTESSDRNKRSLTKQSSDEMDVVTPYKENISSEETRKLLHSGEFHDAALPTKVSRNNTPVVSEFKNVLVYFLLWNN